MRIAPLRLLQRSDKWYLANGKGAMYAPAFPRWLDRPGFWDECYWAEVRLERAFTVLILDAAFQPIPLTLVRRQWRPDRLVQEWKAYGLRVREVRAVVGDGAFTSQIRVSNRGRKDIRLHLILWSMPEYRGEEAGGPAVFHVKHEGDFVTFGLKGTQREQTFVLSGALGADRSPTSHTMNLSEHTDTAPLWEISPFGEKVREFSRLAGDEKVQVGRYRDGHLHIGLHYALALGGGQADEIAFGLGVSADERAARSVLASALKANPAAASEREWKRFFKSVPYFECSDPYLTAYYWHRWYGLRLLMVSACRGHLRHPCVFEGIDGFRWHISYSAQCHMRECRWMHFPAFAEGSLRNFLVNQLDNGSLPGHIGVWSHDQGFYHADWGDAALAVYAVHPDKGALKAVFEPLARYAGYFARERDREGTHLYDVINQGETGQEYASRYLFADPDADTWKEIRLKGVDSTVYIYNLQRGLGRMASILERPDEQARWEKEAHATGRAILEKMWDADRQEFCDVNAQTGERSPYSPAVSFYPFFTDLVGREHLGAIRNHLLSSQRFWTKFPLPTVALDDPYFDAEAEWKGRRHACPWSGRVWPMTNSHVCEALATAALRLDDSLRKPAADLLNRFVQMMFFDGDQNRPNCFEHYNPFTGRPCTYRGIDDYQHSWVVDLILKYVAGVQPQVENLLLVDPLPFDLEHFTADRLRIKGHKVKVTWQREQGLRVYVDGRLRASRRDLGRIEVPLEPR